MMRVITIIIFIIIITFIPTVYATDSTPSADIKSKLEELKKEIASKAAQLKLTVDRKLKNKAYAGTVQSKTDTTLTLTTPSGPKTVNINQDSVFDTSIKSKKKFSKATLALEDYVAALGDSDEKGVVTAKKIILLAATNLSPKTYVWGQVISISDQLTTIKTNSKNTAAVLPKPSQTWPEGSSVKLNSFVILTGFKNADDIFEAGFAYLIPHGAVIKPKKIATRSAEIATPSASLRSVDMNVASPATPKPASR